MDAVLVGGNGLYGPPDGVGHLLDDLPFMSDPTGLSRRYKTVGATSSM
jgi:hypothetical protein